MSNLFLTKPISVPLSANATAVTDKLCRFLHVSKQKITNITLHKQSIDARNKGDVHFVCSYVVETCCNTLQNATPYEYPQDVLDVAPCKPNGHSVIVVGAGPSGLFLARFLTLQGFDVTVVERGSDVQLRQSKVRTFWQGGVFDTETNVQFGLGGAGTFSDGKLTTGTSSPLTYTVFNEFVRCGAPRDILTDSLPHVGTDKLVQVVANLRDEIIAHGGKFVFDCRVDGFDVSDGVCRGVNVTFDNGTQQTLHAERIALCCGHSARNIFANLQQIGAEIAFKPFAVGLRIEHTRQFVNQTQYGSLFATHKDLPSASYKLTNRCNDGHGCYSFCMCPGGVVVCANSEKNTVVVNGMSDYDRLANNSNSAIVVTVDANDVANYGFGNDCMSGVRFQQHLESLAYNLGGGNYVAPCQNVTDFVANKISTVFDVTPSYQRGVTPVNLRELLPKQLGDDIAESLQVFDNKMHGFARCGVLTGVETRTSSPVKIIRDETFQSNIARLYPVGEGAGYSGGIVSSAVDGLRVAQAIAKSFEP